jgi:hypothetical protein
MEFVAVGAIVLALIMVMFVYVIAIDMAMKQTRRDMARRIGRVNDKLDLLLAQAGVRLDTPDVPRLDEIRELARSGKKIHAIKLYRNVTGADLAEAKNAVEQLA